MAAAKLAKMKRGRPGKVSKETNTDLSLAEAADELKVSRATVARGKKVLAKGTPELVAKVEQGDIAVSKAAQIAALTAEKLLALTDVSSRRGEAGTAAERTRYLAWILYLPVRYARPVGRLPRTASLSRQLAKASRGRWWPFRRRV